MAPPAAAAATTNLNDMTPARVVKHGDVARANPSPVGALATECVVSWDRLSALKAPGAAVAPQVDGETMTIADVVGVARYHVVPRLSTSRFVRARVDASVKSLATKLARGESLYGISTGFGGSADSRTSDMHSLQIALLQHQQIGILPSSAFDPTPTKPLTNGDDQEGETTLKRPLGLSTDDFATLSMPESFVRGAIVVRMNSLLRGHSGVRWSVVESMEELFFASPLGPVTPLVPLRSSISASGDLSPLSYVAGTLTGNPGLRVWHTAKDGSRTLLSCDQALKMHGVDPISYEPKEALGILNGTAFSTSVAAQAVHDASFLALFTEFTTAMAVEALSGTDASFDPFIHDIARPHPGQVESAATVLSLLKGSRLAQHIADEKVALIGEDDGMLRQDRYPLRTAAQWIGPQLEDILAARRTIEVEINSTTDNPLIDVERDHCAHGGNFQAMAITNAMEKVRLALAHFGKLTFSQLTELINPAMNHGLPANLAATDPSLNFHGKGIDIAMAAATAELGFLASPVSTHVQSAEMHNQAVNSLALICARKTVEAVEVLSMLLSWSVYLLCQAFDLRALNYEVGRQLERYVIESVGTRFGSRQLGAAVYHRLDRRLAERTNMDLDARVEEACAHASYALMDGFDSTSVSKSNGLDQIIAWRNECAASTKRLFLSTTETFLTSPHACRASPFLGKTRAVYEYVRKDLGVPMHGLENFLRFKGEKGQVHESIGERVSKIYEAIRNGDLYAVLVTTLKAA